MLLITENHFQMFHRRIDLWPGNKLNFIVIVAIVLQHRLHDGQWTFAFLCWLYYAINCHTVNQYAKGIAVINCDVVYIVNKKGMLNKRSPALNFVW